MFSIYQEYWKCGPTLDDALWKVGSNANKEPDLQSKMMIGFGLKPEHKFLDLACGCLRGTVKLVDYLSPGNFYCADASSEILSAIPERLKQFSITNTPNVTHLNGFDLENYFDVKFDYILSVSLLTHILPSDVKDHFEGIKNVLEKDGQYFFSIYPLDEDDNISSRGDIGVIAHKKSFLTRVADECGIKVIDIEGNFPNPYLDNPLRVVNSNIGQWVMKAVHK